MSAVYSELRVALGEIMPGSAPGAAEEHARTLVFENSFLNHRPACGAAAGGPGARN